MIESYCGEHPEESTAKGELDTESFERGLGSKVALKCAEGYSPEGTEQLEAVCTARTGSTGVWVANGWCKCGEEGVSAFLILLRVF